jgi:hypothetical protein
MSFYDTASFFEHRGGSFREGFELGPSRLTRRESGGVKISRRMDMRAEA